MTFTSAASEYLRSFGVSEAIITLNGVSGKHRDAIVKQTSTREWLLRFWHPRYPGTK